GGWAELAEGGVNLCRHHLDGGFMDVGAITLAEEVRGEIAPKPDVLLALFFPEPILVAARFPTAQDILIQAPALLAEFFDDAGVGDPVEELFVDAVADIFGQAGDFADATMAVGQYEWG